MNKVSKWKFLHSQFVKNQTTPNIFVQPNLKEELVLPVPRAERGEEEGATIGAGGGLMRELDTLQMDDFNDLCTGFQK